MINKVFVYGTLRPGEVLYGNMGDIKHEHKPGKVRGDLYLNTGGWFPVFKFGDGEVVGDVLIIDKDDLELTLDRLDSVEGTPWLYTRETIVTADGDECYIYVGNNAQIGAKIESGDFIKHMNFIENYAGEEDDI